MPRNSSRQSRPAPPHVTTGQSAAISRGQGREAGSPSPTVSGRWLLAAFTITILLAACCGYGALCLLFYQGQWQLLFHPSRSISSTPASDGMAFDDIRFDVDETGSPRLDGWWIPASPQGRYAADTILYLHGERGSLSDSVPALRELHELGINAFAIDYRGFGLSAGRHPTERLATQDSIAAWTYLTDTRHIPARDLVVFGDGVGATFAAHLAIRFAPAGIILEDPNPPASKVFASDARARILPMSLLQKEKLDPAGDLTRAHVPRLFMDRGGDGGRTYQLFEVSSYPKQYFDLRSGSQPQVGAILRRFLDQVLQ